MYVSHHISTLVEFSSRTEEYSRSGKNSDGGFCGCPDLSGGNQTVSRLQLRRQEPVGSGAFDDGPQHPDHGSACRT